MVLGVTNPLVSVKVPFTVASTVPLKVTPELLFTVKLLNVVATDPKICCALVPVNCMVLVDGVKVPLLTQFPLMAWVKILAFKVVPNPIVTALFIVVPPSNVFVPLPLVVSAP